jgi:pimeloyl-ACP methyl ester carboxylesterase
MSTADIKSTLPYTVLPRPPTKDGETPKSILLIHGAFCCAASHMDLAQSLLALGYWPIVYSRRGRLNSPAFPNDYSMATEVQDAVAILRETGARLVFGLSSGALITLAVAKYLAESEEGKTIKLKGITIFEPVLMNKEVYGDFAGVPDEVKEKQSTGDSKQVRLEKRYRAQIAANDYAGALVSAMFIVQMGPSWAEYVPERVWKWLVSLAMKSEERKRAKKDSTVVVKDVSFSPTIYSALSNT